jgi:glycosyltransferase involved in cell wall biosynthesis
MRKILLVAPVPTHPSLSGASARVRTMGASLLSMGHEVHFLHLQQPLRLSDAAMREYWKDRLHVFRGLTPAGCIRRGRRKLLRVTAQTFHLNVPLDSYFDVASSRYVRDLAHRYAYDVVIVTYIFYTRLFEAVPDRVLKLVDTLDVFSDRYRLYQAQGQTGEWFSTSREEEGKALDRADAVLAIQESDASHFRSLTRKPVLVVGHLAPPVAGAVRQSLAQGGQGILFVGGPMGINVHGVTWFIEQVLPLVRRQVADAELWLVGGICDRILGEVPGVRRFGFVDSLDDVYGRAAAVVNPQRFGTGVSIKSVDALVHGAPLVTTASGARGLEDGAGTAFLQAASAEEFAERLVQLLQEPARAEALAERGGAFAGRYYQRNLRALADVVSGADIR